VGLSLSEAWLTSPRSLSIVTKAKHEASLDELEQKIHASYATIWFHHQKKLGHQQLQKMLPQRKRPGGGAPRALTMEEEIARQDAWANGINRRIARAEKQRLHQEAKAASKAARRSERGRP
jgi:hypothetical protein